MYQDELKHFHDCEMIPGDTDEISYRTGISKFTVTAYLNGNGKNPDVAAQIYAVTESIKEERNRRQEGSEWLTGTLLVIMCLLICLADNL